MGTFADDMVKPAMRNQLLRYARWEVAGHLDNKPDSWVAQRIRRLAPALADATDTQVVDAFGVLVDEVATHDSLIADPHIWLASDEDVEEEMAALLLYVDATLLALVPEGAL